MKSPVADNSRWQYVKRYVVDVSPVSSVVVVNKGSLKSQDPARQASRSHVSLVKAVGRLGEARV